MKKFKRMFIRKFEPLLEGTMLSFILLALIAYPDMFAEDANLQGDIPISTQWMIDAAGPTGRAAINSVFLILVKKHREKVPGFLLKIIKLSQTITLLKGMK